MSSRRVLNSALLCLTTLASINKGMAEPLELREVAPQVSLPISLELRPDILAERREVTLADIAKCTDFRRRCEEAYGIILGQSPAPGEIAELSRSQIGAVITSEWPDAQITFSGAETTKVVAAQASIDAGEVRAAIQDTLAKFDDGRKRMTLSNVTLISPPKVRPGEHRIKVDFPESSLGSQQQTFNLMASYLTIENETFSFKIIAQVQFENLVLTAGADIRAGDMIGEHQVAAVWQRGPGQANFLHDLPQAIGRQAKMAIPKGAPISLYALQIPHVVNRGKVIDIILEKSGVTVQTKAEAQLDGAVGDSIPVKTLEGKKTLSAKIIDQNTAKVVI